MFRYDPFTLIIFIFLSLFSTLKRRNLLCQQAIAFRMYCWNFLPLNSISVHSICPPLRSARWGRTWERDSGGAWLAVSSGWLETECISRNTLMSLIPTPLACLCSLTSHLPPPLPRAGSVEKLPFRPLHPRDFSPRSRNSPASVSLNHNIWNGVIMNSGPRSSVP